VKLPPTALVRDPTSKESQWWWFEEPNEVLSVESTEEIISALTRIEEAADQGAYAVGYLTYEASPAFDRALTTRGESPLPLLWFGLFDRPKIIGEEEALSGVDPAADLALDWSTSVTMDEHADAIGVVREAIAEGSTYQVNLTHRLRSAFHAAPMALFKRLYGAQPSPYAALLDTGQHVVASASPELFFSLRGERIVSRPMKGTATRGRHLEEDRDRVRQLAESEKDRSENLMIVDMMRNDIGRIANPGSVVAEKLFEIERHRTVLQMVSEVEAKTTRSLVEIFEALFPAASITGAPKASTMSWIQRLEHEPRGVYTGAIGTVRPGRQADFSVAIRTAHIDTESETVEYGTGGGIVWDSRAPSEWAETQTKARILGPPAPAFQLLETLRWSADTGFHLLGLHLDRIGRSAEYFGYPIDIGSIENELNSFIDDRSPPEPDSIVRLLVSASGEIEIESLLLQIGAPWRIGVANTPVDSNDRFLFHKTTHRTVYERAAQAQPECDDVLLWNESHDWTESTRANLVVYSGGVAYTPPVECGLLAGTEREHRLRRGELTLKKIGDRDLLEADRVVLLNSVRGEIEVDPGKLAARIAKLRTRSVRPT